MINWTNNFKNFQNRPNNNNKLLITQTINMKSIKNKEMHLIIIVI